MPMLNQIAQLTKTIEAYDEDVQRLAATKYSDLAPLRTVYGVGPLTALTFVLTLGDKHRFAVSRDVGCYLGLRPRRSQSGEYDPQLPITKAGDRYLRTLLVETAHLVLGPRGPDTALRRWGRKLAERGGKNAKKRAIIAVARKLAILLHRLWVTQENYRPFPYVDKAAAC
jgi:transposase